MLRFSDQARHGGDLIAEVLAQNEIPYVFTLCGGHISPILVGATERGIRVVDTRDEKNAVFAADAVARMTGKPGVVAVTAGPGVTNAITALKNAQMAQSPLVLFGGATATVLKGRGALQDIDQLAIIRASVKWVAQCSTVGQLGPTVEKALRVAAEGIPGPVFVEVPVDLLYPEELVRDWFLTESGVKDAKSLGSKALKAYLQAHLYRQFNLPHIDLEGAVPEFSVAAPKNLESKIDKTIELLRNAKRPALVIGSQALVNCSDPTPLADAVRRLGMPTWLGGMARGLLGQHSDIQFRHKRGKALKEADVVVIAGFPFDFRMKYGQSIGKGAKVVSANLSSTELRKNRRPDVALQMPAGDFLVRLAALAGVSGIPSDAYGPWFETLRAREQARDNEIDAQANPASELVDPVHFFKRLEAKMDESAVMVADGGDFVATASYIVRPRSPLSWLDPGVFGTLGVGGGFAVGAALVRPKSEVWIIYGDGSSAYSLAEFDTFARHGLAPIALIGNDASWAQIARDQVTLLGSDIGTTLVKTDYHKVAKGYGGVGLKLDKSSNIDAVLDEAKKVAKSGKPVCINVHIARTDFRKGSISI